MKKIILSVLLILLTMFSFPAFASEPAKEIVYRGLSIGIYDVWVYSDGRLQISESQKANWGETFTREPEYPLPQLSEYILTRVEVKNQNPTFNEKEFTIFNDKGYVFKDTADSVGFERKYLKQLKEKYNYQNQIITLTPDQKGVKLKITGKIPNNLTDLIEHTTDIKNNEQREWYDLPTPYDPVGLTYGGRFHALATITVYGIPKEQPALPDAYVKEIKTTATETEEGKAYNATVTYGMKGPYEGVVPCKIGLTHNGYSVSNIDGQTLNLSAWEEKTYEFTFTGQKGKDSVLEAKIWPDAGDKDWDNNSKKLVIPQKVEFDLEAYLESVSAVESGTTERFGGWLYNKSGVPITTKGVWRANGKIVKTINNITIPANEGIRTTYDFSIPAGTATGKLYQVEIEVNPDRNQPSAEKTWSNNKNSDTIEAYLGKSGGGLKGDTIID